MTATEVVHVDVLNNMSWTPPSTANANEVSEWHNSALE